MKRILSVVLIFFACIVVKPVCAYELPLISCSASIYGRHVIINGEIPDGNESTYVSLVVGHELKDAIYVYQVNCDTNGSFSFEFDFSPFLDFGDYPFVITSNAPVSQYEGVLSYVENDYDSEFGNEFCDIDLEFTIKNYIPHLTGSISCEEGKSMSYTIDNVTDNNVIGSHNWSSGEKLIDYQLPSLLSGKIYDFEIKCTQSQNELLSIEFQIDSSILYVSFDGNINLGDGVIINANVNSTDTTYIDKSLSINKSSSLSSTLPNVLANVTYDLTAKVYETIITHSYINDCNLTGRSNEVFSYSVIVNHMFDDNDVYIIRYDSSEISVVSFNNSDGLGLQLGDRGNVRIIDCQPGKIKFKKITDSNGYDVISGTVNIFDFRFNEHFYGNTTITLEY